MGTPHQAAAKLFDYIEENRQNPITLEQMSEACGLSRFQLIRLCSRICGKTPMEYVRARRLAGSLPQLLRGDRILDVALEWGFDYEQSYIRSFRDTFGTTPAQFRRSQQTLGITEIPRLEGFTVSADGMLGNPRLLARPAYAVTGRLKAYNYACNELDGLPLAEGLEEVRVKEQRFYAGFCRPNRRNRFEHEYLIEEKPSSMQEEGKDDSANREWVEWHWPPGEWVQFKYIGFHPLDRPGIRRLRLMASLVAGMWYAERGLRWEGSFIERVDCSWLGEDYCEVELECPLTVY